MPELQADEAVSVAETGELSSLSHTHTTLAFLLLSSLPFLGSLDFSVIISVIAEHVCVCAAETASVVVTFRQENSRPAFKARRIPRKLQVEN